MKFTSVAVLVLAVVSTTYAAECTQSQLSSYNAQANIEKLMTDCAASISLASSTVGSPTNAKKICSDDKCMGAIESLMANTPDCSILGENFKAKYLGQFSTIQSGCKSLGVPIHSATTAPSTTTRISSASAVAAASWAVTAAVLALLA